MFYPEVNKIEDFIVKSIIITTNSFLSHSNYHGMASSILFD